MDIYMYWKIYHESGPKKRGGRSGGQIFWSKSPAIPAVFPRAADVKRLAGCGR
jgi:hypothetical protein